MGTILSGKKRKNKIGKKMRNTTEYKFNKQKILSKNSW